MCLTATVNKNSRKPPSISPLHHRLYHFCTNLSSTAKRPHSPHRRCSPRPSVHVFTSPPLNRNRKVYWYDGEPEKWGYNKALELFTEEGKTPPFDVSLAPICLYRDLKLPGREMKVTRSGRELIKGGLELSDSYIEAIFEVRNYMS